MLEGCIHFFLNLDTHLLAFISSYGSWAYGLLFLIIFCETGLVVTPFLPGDSLLFVAGNIAAQANQPIQVTVLFLLLVAASWFGNQLNYMLGHFIGPKIFKSKKSMWLNPRYLQEAHDFYEKNGKLALIFARFVPIIRTFVPFVAGMASMNLWIYSLYNLFSAILWIGMMLYAGYFLGHIPFIQSHFVLFIYSIIVISLLPSIWVCIRSYFKKSPLLDR